MALILRTSTTAGTGGTRFQSKGGWMGFGDHFWLAALIPPAKDAQR